MPLLPLDIRAICSIHGHNGHDECDLRNEVVDWQWQAMVVFAKNRASRFLETNTGENSICNLQSGYPSIIPIFLTQAPNSPRFFRKKHNEFLAVPWPR